jgi:predicted Zn-dependent protease
MKHSGAVIALVILAAIGAVIGCATNPVTGKSQFSLVSQEQEIQMGKEGYQAVLQEYGAYSDAKITSYVDSIGHRLASVSHQPDLEWHFTVLDDQVVNAFAMPGGYIFISRGILGYLNSEAQLAGVLGHEIGHVTAKHTAARMSQQQLAGLGIGLGGVFSRTFQRYSSVAQQALGFAFLKYSRDDETQADQLGVDYATKAGWDPREIPMTYVMLRRVGEQSGQSMPSFMSTHPDPGDRETRTRELAKTAAAGKTGLVIHGREYIRHVDGLVFGIDPTQGYFDGTTFIHPGLATQVTFPTGWKTQNTHEAVLGASPDQASVVQLTLTDSKGLSPSAYVADLERAQKITGAEGREETINGQPAWVGHLGIIKQDGTQAAVTAAIIQHDTKSLFQLIGQGDDSAILGTARSLKKVTDPAKLNVAPTRVKVVTVDKTGPFDQVVATYGPQALDPTSTSILNIVEPDETVNQGTLLKIVPKPKK